MCMAQETNKYAFDKFITIRQSLRCIHYAYCARNLTNREKNVHSNISNFIS